MRGFPDVRCLRRIYIQLVEVTSRMHVGQPGTQTISPVRASGRVSLVQNGGQVLAIAFIAGVTWLALIGATLGWSIVGERVTSTLASALPFNAATYQVEQRVPTPFGSLSVTAVDPDAAGTSEDAPPDQVQVQVFISLSNERDGAVWSPTVEEFRVVSARGTQAEPLARLSLGTAVLYPHTNNSLRLGFLVPRDGSPLWLEYRATRAASPIRISLGQP